jgi:ubiquinone/menaquinone biosynthesis C-methylase UbiE
MLWISIAILLGGFGICAVWWLFIETEGVYLGRRVVIWLYDLYANRYDTIKEFQPEYEQALLAQPLMGQIAPHQSPLVLDVATGTGRLPLALFDHVHFQGRIIGIDLSRRTLSKASVNLKDDRDSLDLIWCPAEKLPFPDDMFDVVTCLEAIEFMTNATDVIAEIARVLRPGGLLLLTNRINTRWMPGKVISDDQLEQFLINCNISEIDIELWQEDYHRVWGQKAGDSLATGAHSLIDVLRCLCNLTSHFVPVSKTVWRCEACGMNVAFDKNGVLQLFAMY